MTHPSLHWKSIKNVEEFDQILERSRTRPALLFKHEPSSAESLRVKQDLEANWIISADMLDTYLVDNMHDKDVLDEVTQVAGVPNEIPQIFLFADGVTMYDESHELINVRKIKIALKIINRTFKWLETRV
ncbi:MAG: DUF2847 family protein [Cytophagales bacterium]|nr:DUF2847 family protein [Cytophagales bacterium]